MLLKDIADRNYFPQIRKSKIWDKSIYDLTKTDMMVAFERIKHDTDYHSAASALLLLKHKLTNALDPRDDRHCSAMDYRVPVQRLLAQEFADLLEQIPIKHRQALMFCLLTDLSASRVTSLTWKQAKKLRSDASLNPLARDMLNKLPRHIASPLVFWEQKAFKALPLIGFVSQWQKISGMSLSQSRACYEQLIFVDVDAESARQAFDKYYSDIKKAN